MEIIDKMVDFNKYCKDCKYYELNEAFDPCNDCLNNPVNTYSKKPVNFKNKDED